MTNQTNKGKFNNSLVLNKIVISLKRNVRWMTKLKGSVKLPHVF
jgi:hypothetical protein